MMPGPVQIIACPNCGCLARQSTLSSGNTLGSILWSDGKLEAPMLPEESEVARCCGCKGFYWVREAEIIGEIEGVEDESKPVPEEWERADAIRPLTVDEYIEALDMGVGNDPQKERYLRLHFWWAVNDLVRGDAKAQIPEKYAERWRENLVELSALLKRDDPQDMIMKAEIAREMGDFNQAIRLLETVPENLRWAADPIRKLAKEKKTRVTELLSDPLSKWFREKRGQ